MRCTAQRVEESVNEILYHVIDKYRTDISLYMKLVGRRIYTFNVLCRDDFFYCKVNKFFNIILGKYRIYVLGESDWGRIENLGYNRL